MKIFAVFLLIIINFCPISYAVGNTIDFDIYGFCDSLSNFENSLINKEEYSSIIKDIQKGDFKFEYKKLFNNFGKFFSKEIKENIGLIIQIILISILTGFLSSLKSSFDADGVGEIAFYICYIVIVTLIMSSFIQITDIAAKAISELSSFMQVILPVLISLMVSTGGTVSSSMIYPVIIFFSQTIANMMNNFMLPITMTAFAVGIIANISAKVNISKVSSILKSVSVWILGITLTLFVGILSIEGTIGSTIDGITVKTAKFMFSNSVPVVGKILGDSIDTILGSTLILKNAIGVLGVIILLGIVLTPILKIIILLSVYGISSALIQPFAEKRVTQCIDDTVGTGKVVLGIVATVTVIFIIGIVAMLKMSNTIAMLR